MHVIRRDGGLASVQKSCGVAGRWHQAGLGAPEHPVAIAGNPPVKRVSKQRRYQPPDPRQSPRPSQRVKDAKDRRRVLPAAFAIDQQQRLEAIDLETGARQQFPPDDALNRREPKHAPVVVAKQKLHPAIAEQALRIEDDDQVLA